jgi:ribonucleoside-diphosphate reductase beta chain
MYSVFPLNKQNHLTAKMFLDEGGSVNIARYEKVKYPLLAGFTKKQKAVIWFPEEVNLTADNVQFDASLVPYEQDIVMYAVLRNMVLDSVQGRAPMLAFAPITGLPELEGWLTWWTAMEQVHSDSYTWIIRNVFPDPSKVIDKLLEIEPIIDCAKSVSEYYDNLIYLNNYRALKDSLDLKNYDEYEHKKALWLALIAVNALEGIRFYASFATMWAFAESKRMEGNAKIFKLICRDENLHLGSTQQILKILPKDDPDFERIRRETEPQSRQIFIDVANQEIIWAKFLFRYGSILGLNEELLTQYIQFITTKRMRALKYESPYKITSNPLPWTEKWIAGAEVQVAPQETEITSYTTGDVKKDVTVDFLKGLSL